MSAVRIYFAFIPLGLVFFSSIVFAAPKFTADPNGNLYQFDLAKGKLTISKSIDQGMSFGEAQPLNGFTFEAQAVELKSGGYSEIYAAFGTTHEAFVTYTTDGGKSFHSPIVITSEAAASPSLAVDGLGKAHLLYITKDKLSGLNRINYASATNLNSLEATLEAMALFETPNEILNPKLSVFSWGVAAAWQMKIGGKLESSVIFSLDHGKSFGKRIALFNPEEIAGLEFIGGGWKFFVYDQKLIFKEFTPSAAFAPAHEIISPKTGVITNSPTIEIRYSMSGAPNAICYIEISPELSFPPDRTWSFETIKAAASSEANYPLPIDLPDGAYSARISAFDGISSSPPAKPIAFRIDRAAPVIRLSNITRESESQILPLEGEISEFARLSINGKPVTLEAGNKFRADLALLAGENKILITATDEAGNNSFSAQSVHYHSTRPQIRAVKPKASDWFKPGSTIFIEAEIGDLQNDIEDEAEGGIAVAGKILDDKLTYSKKDKKLSGFVILPETLAEGELEAKIGLKDLAGNSGAAAFKINIDSRPPALTLLPGEAAFINPRANFKAPARDDGAGIDGSASRILIAGISLEGVATSEPDYWLKAKQSIPDGTYEAMAVLRDKIGNIGPAQSFSVVVDTTPPQIELLSALPPRTAQNKISLKLKAADSFLSSVKIYDNQKLIDSFTPAEKEFTKEIPLLPGNNEIVVSAVDKAGNESALNLRIQADVRASAALVNKFGNGPNPFSPKTDGQMSFTYDLPSAANLKIYLFDLTGTLIWKKEAGNVTSGSIPWNGIDQFGSAAAKGAYPYIMQFSAGGNLEIKRGKVIVL